MAEMQDAGDTMEERSPGFRALVEAAAREAVAREAKALGDRMGTALREEHEQALLDIETLERQLASLDANVAALQDRLQALASRIPS